MAAQLVAFDSVRYCAPSAGGTAPLVFMPTRELDPAQHGVPARTRTALASLRMPPVRAKRIGGRLERNRAPSDSEEGVPLSAVTAANGAMSLASLAPRTAWHLANSASQLVMPDASWGVIWAWHTTPNVTSATTIAARLLQRTRDESAAAMANPGMLLRYFVM